MPEFVTLTIRPTESEARTLAATLETNGIPCLLNGSRLARFTEHLPANGIGASSNQGGVELKVEAENLLVARTLLDLDVIEAKDRLLWSTPRRRPVSICWKLNWCLLAIAGVLIWPVTPEARWSYLGVTVLIGLWFWGRE